MRGNKNSGVSLEMPTGMHGPFILPVPCEKARCHFIGGGLHILANLNKSGVGPFAICQTTLW